MLLPPFGSHDRGWLTAQADIDSGDELDRIGNEVSECDVHAVLGVPATDHAGQGESVRSHLDCHVERMGGPPALLGQRATTRTSNRRASASTGVQISAVDAIIIRDKSDGSFHREASVPWRG